MDKRRFLTVAGIAAALPAVQRRSAARRNGPTLLTSAARSARATAARSIRRWTS